MPRPSAVAALLLSLLHGVALAQEPARSTSTPAEPPPAAPETAADVVTASATPDLRPALSVKDVDDLAALVKGDVAAAPMAARLARRRTTAWAIFGAGAAVTVGCVGYAASHPGRSTNPADPNFRRDTAANTAMAVGVGVGVVSTLVGLFVFPGRADLQEVVTAWNGAHPDQQAVVGEAPAR